MSNKYKAVDKRASKWCSSCQEEHPFCEHCGLGHASRWSFVWPHHHHIIVSEVIHEFWPIYFRRNWPEHIIFVCSTCHGKLHREARVLVEAFGYKFRAQMRKLVVVPWEQRKLSADECLKIELELRYQLGDELLKGLLNQAFNKVKSEAL